MHATCEIRTHCRPAWAVEVRNINGVANVCGWYMLLLSNVFITNSLFSSLCCVYSFLDHPSLFCHKFILLLFSREDVILWLFSYRHRNFCRTERVCAVVRLCCPTGAVDAFFTVVWRQYQYPSYAHAWAPSISFDATYIYFFFFFLWRYSPLWALACRTISLHFSLSVKRLRWSSC